MNRSYGATAPVEKLQEYDRPILFSSGGGQIWHVPKISNGEAVFACGQHRAENLRVTSLSNFKRRRNQRMCKMCKEQVESGEYPEDAPIDGDGQ